MPATSTVAAMRRRTASRLVKRMKRRGRRGEHLGRPGRLRQRVARQLLADHRAHDLAVRPVPGPRRQDAHHLAQVTRRGRAGLGDRGAHQVAQLVLAEWLRQELRQDPGLARSLSARSWRPAFS